MSGGAFIIFFINFGNIFISFFMNFGNILSLYIYAYAPCWPFCRYPWGYLPLPGFIGLLSCVIGVGGSRSDILWPKLDAVAFKLGPKLVDGPKFWFSWDVRLFLFAW